MSMKICNWSQLTPQKRGLLLARPAQAQSAQVTGEVAAIIHSVRNGGDAALRDLTARLDGVKLDALQVSEQEMAAAEAAIAPDLRAAINAAIRSIGEFHEAQRPATLSLETVPGVRCERISQPLDSVGLYVPGGTAPLPSTVMMLAVPARLAGCPLRILCTPPGPQGRVEPAILFAARACGVHKVFRIGGAQAIAAMAYGTQSVPRVVKLFGPGNQWVTSAKTQVSSEIGGAACDMPAGPSELVVIADDTADPAYCAADLLSQAEHGADSQVLLFTDSSQLAQAVQLELHAQRARLKRQEIVEASLARSACFIVKDIDEAIEISNSYAPEHLILNVAKARSWLGRVRNAGSVFLGPWAPESVGDYCSGTNHVLPTYGWARSHSGLGLSDFMRSMTVQELSADGLRRIADTACTLARAEGLDAHARAIELRLPDKREAVA